MKSIYSNEHGRYVPVQQQLESEVPRNNVVMYDDADNDVPVMVEIVRPLEQVHQEHQLAHGSHTQYAGCVGACVGCLTGGFWMALICGTGCLYAAAQDDGSIGDIARSCGRFGVKANKMARDIDEQHHVIDKTKNAAEVVWTKAKVLNEEHQIVTKTKDCVVSSVQAGVRFSQEHRLVERATIGVKSVVDVVAEQVSNEVGNRSASSTANEQPHTMPEVTVTETSPQRAQK